MVNKNKNTKLDEYKYSVLVGVGSFLIAIVLIFAVGQPMLKGMQETGKKLKEKKEVLAKLQDKLETLKKLKEKESEIRDKNQRVSAALPTDKDISRLFVQFESIASQNGLRIDSVQEAGAATSSSAAASSSSGGVRAVSYTVTGTADSYASLKNALTKLEESLRILNVSKVEVTGQQGQLNVTLTVSTYVRGSN
jgi:Tfp pilus assembly protein PilO